MLPPNQPFPNPIEHARKAVLDFANAVPFFQQLPIQHDERGDIEQKVRLSIEKLGLVCAFEVLSGAIKYPSLSAWAMDVRVAFTITENVLINRDERRPNFHGKIATDVLCELYAAFHPRRESPVILGDFETLSNTSGIIILQVPGTMRIGWRETQ